MTRGQSNNNYIIFILQFYFRSPGDQQPSSERRGDLDLDLEPVSQPEVRGQYESIQKTTDSSDYYNVHPNPYQSLNPESEYEIVN